MGKDYYAILGVNKGASADDIKSAFRKLSKQCHPDLNPNNQEAVERFKEINEANSVLSDPQKRAQYDNPNPFEGIDMFGGFTGFGNGFNSMRNHRPDPNRPIQGKDLKFVVDVSVSKFIFGGEEEFTFNYMDVCTECDGKGAKHLENCPTCNGSGVIIEQMNQQGMHIMRQTPCRNCRGTGTIKSDICTNCNGVGEITTEKNINIQIPSDIKDGHIIKKQLDGGKGRNGGTQGDLFIKLRMSIPKASSFNEEQRGAILNLFA